MATPRQPKPTTGHMHIPEPIVIGDISKATLPNSGTPQSFYEHERWGDRR